MDLIKRAKEFLFGRRLSYLQTFDKNNQAAQAVLKDLAKFCRANQTTFLPDPRAHAMLEGRREVWLRIQQHLNLSPEQLWELFGTKGDSQ